MMYILLIIILLAVPCILLTVLCIWLLKKFTGAHYKTIVITVMSMWLLNSIWNFISTQFTGYYCGALDTFFSVQKLRDLPFNLRPDSYKGIRGRQFVFMEEPYNAFFPFAPWEAYNIVAYGYTDTYITIQYVDTCDVISYLKYDGNDCTSVDKKWISEHKPEMTRWVDLYYQGYDDENPKFILSILGIVYSGTVLLIMFIRHRRKVKKKM